MTNQSGNAMKILWLTWKDRSHPRAGGAEIVNEELAKRLVQNSHEVTFLTSLFEGAAPQEKREGFSIIRMGNRFTVYWKAYRYYKKHLTEWPDLVVDEMNTIPFFAKFYVKQKNIMFVHQLCREIWFYQMPLPLSLIGYILEPLYLWLLNDTKVVTISQSSKRDLMRLGFKAEKIHIISEGIEMEAAKDLVAIKKFSDPTILALGAIRPMKRTHSIVKAFEHVKSTLPNARLILAGLAEGSYGERVVARAKRSTYAADIEYLGRIDEAKKLELLQKAHVLCATSVKEGWGLVVTEAASQGTPAAVYDVDGLRDSVKDGETGVVSKKNMPASLAESIVGLLKDEKGYAEMRRGGWEWSKEINFDTSYNQFLEVVKKYV